MNIPRVQGLVLAGGRSSRMQRDKAALEFRAGETQLDTAMKLLSTRVSKAFVSVRADQKDDPARSRFPHIVEFCSQQGFDITQQPVPVVPAAHYFMGGLHTDLHGRTSVKGLFAAGEAASTGVHGANRLASNSLLECVVFGRRAAVAMKDTADANRDYRSTESAVRVPLHSESARSVIRDAAWLGAGIIRSESAVKESMTVLDTMEQQWEARSSPSLEQLETSNLLVVARVILQSALVRLESRGAHYRADYPERNDTFRCHSWTTSHGTSIGLKPLPPRK